MDMSTVLQGIASSSPSTFPPVGLPAWREEDASFLGKVPTDTHNTSVAQTTSAMLTDVPHFPLVRQPVHMVVIYSLAYSIVFVSGIVGNSLVVSMVMRDQRMHTVTNYFIVNLAIADILVCFFCLPITLMNNLFSGWRFGAAMCKVTPYLQGVAVSASVNTLTAIAFDRYLAICHTLDHRLSHRAARLIIACIWFLALVLMTPWAVYYQQEAYHASSSLYICKEDWPSMAGEKGFFLGAIFLTFYTIPLVFITVFYAHICYRVWHRNAPGISNTCQVIYKSKIKVLKMMMVVVILFAFSWLPLYVVRLRIYFGEQPFQESSDFTFVTQTVIPIAQWLGSSNSCVNPIIYCFFSNKFRKGFRNLFMTCCRSNSSSSHFTSGVNTTYRSNYGQNGHSLYSSVRSSEANSVKKPHTNSTFV